MFADPYPECEPDHHNRANTAGAARCRARCREFALRHAEGFSALITRMGCWADLGQAYSTMDASFVESVWWSLRQLFEAGLLVSERRPTPYCPRCQTPLSEYDLRAPGTYRKVMSTVWTVRLRLCTVPGDTTPCLRGAGERGWVAPFVEFARRRAA